MSILCKLGFHKDEFVEEDGSPTYGIITIGFPYRYHCKRCHRITPIFTLTRDMLP